MADICSRFIDEELEDVFLEDGTRDIREQMPDWHLYSGFMNWSYYGRKNSKIPLPMMEELIEEMKKRFGPLPAGEQPAIAIPIFKSICGISAKSWIPINSNCNQFRNWLRT